ncbi:Protein TOXD [Cladophialophora carrionii]|uniref:Protein TOXD n=1 Tax=Cladophialophora carrionii TaxID=86049 RepID=A0A1C1D099_9EURO|nr:Protein TOXD [Cladophialophora carrionii]
MLEIGVQRKDGVISSEARNVPIPEPAEDEVLIKVVATDSNPKDWKASARPVKTNQGDDIAGMVHKVGQKVHEFKPGDRVAAFHRMFSPSGSYAEYAIAPASTTFFLPPNISFESGATLPLASMTAALALYQHLGLPAPWNPVSKGKRVPLLIYGGSSAVGTFALKFAKLSGLSPIITIAGGGADFVRSINAADYIVEYRKKNVVADVQRILDDEGVKLHHAFDAISEHDSWKHVLDLLDKKGSEPGKIVMVDPPEPVVPEWPQGIEFGRVFVSSAYGESHRWCNEEEAKVHRDFAYVFYRYMTLLLAEGRFVPHPYEVQPDGLLAVEKGVQALHDKKVSSKKLVYRIADTPDLDKYH